MAYATIAELSACWRDFSPWEESVLGQTLEDASTFLDAQLAACGRSADQAGADLMRVVCCAVVRRSMGELDATDADDRWQELVGPTSVEVSPAVVHSDFYLTQWERRALGVRVGRASFCGEE